MYMKELEYFLMKLVKKAFNSLSHIRLRHAFIIKGEVFVEGGLPILIVH